MVDYMQLFPLAYFLLENCGSELPVSINPLWYEVETWISNSPCQMKLTGDIVNLIVSLCPRTVFGP